MDNPDVLNDVRFLRDVVARTEPPRVNYYWPVTLAWGILIGLSYLAYALLGRAGNTAVLQWVWPVGMVVATPLNWYLIRRVKRNILEHGIRPRFSQGPDLPLVEHHPDRAAVERRAGPFRTHQQPLVCAVFSVELHLLHRLHHERRPDFKRMVLGRRGAARVDHCRVPGGA